MKESLKKLLLKLSSDEKLFLQLTEKNTITEMYEFCMIVQKGDYSKEEFEHILIKLLRKLVYWKELSDNDELSDVNGGGSFFEFIGNLREEVPNPVVSFNQGKQLGLCLKKFLNGSNNSDTILK